MAREDDEYVRYNNIPRNACGVPLLGMAKSIYYLAKSQWSSQINIPKKLDPFFLILPCLFVSFPLQHSVCFIKSVYSGLDYFICTFSA